MSSPECAPSLLEMVSFKALLDNRLTAWEPEGVVPEMLIRPEMLNHSRTLRGGGLATLIDPAGGLLGDLADDPFDKIIVTNVKSAFQLRTMAIPAMAARPALSGGDAASLNMPGAEV